MACYSSAEIDVFKKKIELGNLHFSFILAYFWWCIFWSLYKIITDHVVILLEQKSTTCMCYKNNKSEKNKIKWIGHQHR